MREHYLKILLFILSAIVIIEGYYLYEMKRSLNDKRSELAVAESITFPKIKVQDNISYDNGRFIQEMERLRQDMERSFMEFENLIYITPSLNTFSSEFFRTPRFDMKEDKDKYIITAELPGCDKDSIKTDIKNGRLIIDAEVSKDEKDKTATYYRHERRTSSYKRDILLPKDIDEKSLKSEYKDGLLIITIEKKAPGITGHFIDYLKISFAG